MAGATGLEPATSGVTGRHSNQLSYAPAGVRASPARRQELSERPCQVKKLSGSGRWKTVPSPDRQEVVGGEGLEPPTSTV
jgi:hypothetical protein